jgi:hypothetical protein
MAFLELQVSILDDFGAPKVGHGGSGSVDCWVDSLAHKANVAAGPNPSQTIVRSGGM